MKFNSKSIFTIFLAIIAIALLLLVLLVTEKLLSIWHYLQEAPLWVSFVYATGIMLVAVFVLYIYWSFIRPKPKQQQKLRTIDESSLRDSMSQQGHFILDKAKA